MKIPIKGEVGGFREEAVVMSRDFDRHDSAETFIAEQRKHGARFEMWVHRVYYGRVRFRVLRRFLPGDDALRGHQLNTEGKKCKAVAVDTDYRGDRDGEEYAPFVVTVYSGVRKKEGPLD